MPRNFSRATRIGDQIQREIADLVRNEIKDPRVGLVTITAVEVAPDYSQAKVFFTRLGNDDDAAGSTQALQRAAGFLRSALFHRLRLRVVPELTFVYDQSIERGVRLTHLIDEAVASDSEKPEPD